MKDLKLLVFSFFLFCGFSISAQTIRSYACMEQGTQGQYPIVPQNIATAATWIDNGTVELTDGTIWRFQRQNYDGTYCYYFAGLKQFNMALPGTNYQALYFSADYSMMKMVYMFSPMGAFGQIQMYSLYSFIGYGVQPSIDWSNQNYRNNGYN